MKLQNLWLKYADFIFEDQSNIMARLIGSIFRGVIIYRHTDSLFCPTLDEI